MGQRAAYDAPPSAGLSSTYYIMRHICHLDNRPGNGMALEALAHER